MTVKYALYPNHLTEKDDYFARVISTGLIDEAALQAFMVQEAGGTTLTREAIMAVSQLRADCIERLLLEGHSVSTPIGHFTLAIRGVFNGLTDSFDPSRHQMVVNARPSTMLKQAVAQLSTEQRDAPEAKPRVQLFEDVSSGTTDSVVTPGGGCHLLGRSIRVDLADPEAGIFFVAADGSETAVTQIQLSSNRHAYFVAPLLAAGVYTLVVRGRFGTRLEEGKLRSPLTVA